MDELLGQNVVLQHSFWLWFPGGSDLFGLAEGARVDKRREKEEGREGKKREGKEGKRLLAVWALLLGGLGWKG